MVWGAPGRLQSDPIDLDLRFRKICLFFLCWLLQLLLKSVLKSLLHHLAANCRVCSCLVLAGGVELVNSMPYATMRLSDG